MPDSYSGPLTDSGEIALWEQYTSRERLGDGSIKASLREDAYPQGYKGNTITGRLVGDSPMQLIQSWFGFVRGRLNAWQDNEAAEAAKRAEASRTDSVGSTPTPERLERSDSPVEENLPSSEATLESILESKIATLRRSLLSLTAEATKAMDAYNVVCERRRVAYAELAKAERALAAATGDSEGSVGRPDSASPKPDDLRSRKQRADKGVKRGPKVVNAQEVRPEVSPSPSPEKKKPRSARSRGLVEGELPSGN